MINEYILLGLYSDKQIRRLTVYGHNWMAENPLSELITYGLKGDEKPSKITSHVKSVMETLESDVRFTFVKYTQLYVQLLRFHLDEVGERDIKIHPISSYLEYGACSLVPLTFMSIGLSRAAAISLSREYGRRQDITREECITWLSRFDVKNSRLSAFLKREIASVVVGLK